MKTTFKIQLASIILLTCHFTYAQGQQVQMPEALSNLMRLEGNWQGQATLTLEGNPHKITYYAHFKKSVDGNGLTMNENFNDVELGSFKGMSLIGYNSSDGKIHWFSLDNIGTAHEHLGTWKSPDHFYMQSNEMQQQKEYIEKIDMILKGKDALELNMVATLDGQVIQTLQGNFQRKME